MINDSPVKQDLAFAALLSTDACRTVVVRFWNFLDCRDYDGVVGWFVLGGIWLRGATELRAPDVMMAVLKQRPEVLAIRHLVSNLDVRMLLAEQAEAVYYVTVYRHEGVTSGPTPLAGPHSITQWRDELVSTPTGWRLLSKTGKRLFEAP